MQIGANSDYLHKLRESVSYHETIVDKMETFNRFAKAGIHMPFEDIQTFLQNFLIVPSCGNKPMCGTKSVSIQTMPVENVLRSSVDELKYHN